MALTAFGAAILLASATPADADQQTFGWCIAARRETAAAARYVSDVFEGPIDATVAATFQEYVVRTYLRRIPESGYRTQCREFHDKAAADAGLATARAAANAGADVMTAWRTHFE